MISYPKVALHDKRAAWYTYHMKKTFLVSLLLLLCIIMPLVVHAFEFDSGGAIRDALQLKDKDAKKTTIDFVRYALSFVGLIAVIMIIYAGARYMTSGGNQEVIQNARAILKWSIVGLFIIILSQAIMTMVVGTIK